MSNNKKFDCNGCFDDLGNLVARCLDTNLHVVLANAIVTAPAFGDLDEKQQQTLRAAVAKMSQIEVERVCNGIISAKSVDEANAFLRRWSLVQIWHADLAAEMRRGWT